MASAEPKIDFRPKVENLCSLWEALDIVESVSVEFSARLRTSLGRTIPQRRLIRLHPLLSSAGSNHLLDEVLCHELAHVVAHYRHGRDIAPHGPEWRALVSSAGFAPSIHLTVDEVPKISSSRVYWHQCPICHSARSARKPMRQWRCGACMEAGLSGELVIKERL